nr:sce7725 family protein [uncultured Blautia sp.]
MYFPILRGRQFELLALRECVNKNIISNQIIPVVEPVKVSSTYIKTMDSFIKAGKSIAVIRNPQVGSWTKDSKKESNAKIHEQAMEQLKESNVISSFYVTSKLSTCIEYAIQQGVPIDSLILICDNPEYIGTYEKVIDNNIPLYNVIPDKGDFRRRIRVNRVMCEDHFPKKTRNIDYLDIENEFFSSDHLFYEADGYRGFSDYSVVGKEYSETGFAPYAVAIHIVYFDTNKILRIAHFVSDSNDDISDPARKFAEAVGKLVEWNKTMKLDTVGIREFEEAYRNKTYPGLGVVKKYSIMHHLELMSNYLDGVVK